MIPATPTRRESGERSDGSVEAPGKTAASAARGDGVGGRAESAPAGAQAPAVSAALAPHAAYRSKSRRVSRTMWRPLPLGSVPLALFYSHDEGSRRSAATSSAL